MGYKSDVKICLKKENFVDLQNIITEISEENYNLMDSGCCAIYKEFGDVIIFGWKDIEWDKGRKDIDVIYEYLETLEKEEIEFEFFRLGEEPLDIEIKEYYYDGECSHIFIKQELYVM